LGTTLVPNDTNEDWDIFARAPVTCGGQTDCTAGTTSNGCAPAITSTGTPSANATSGFTIAVHGVEGQRAGLIFYGVSGRQNLAWATGSTSFLCVALPTRRRAPPARSASATAC
jgi:hypothetical protein